MVQVFPEVFDRFISLMAPHAIATLIPLCERLFKIGCLRWLSDQHKEDQPQLMGDHEDGVEL